MELEQQLTCSICLNLYTDPIIRPCHHVFCKSCIRPIVEKTEPGGAFLCPECRGKCVEAAVQKAFKTNALKDVYDKLKGERSFVRTRAESLSLVSPPRSSPDAAEPASVVQYV